MGIAFLDEQPKNPSGKSPIVYDDGGNSFGPKSGVLRQLSDIPIGLAGGVAGLVNAGLGLGDIATGGQVGNAVDAAGSLADKIGLPDALRPTKWQDKIQSYYTPEMKAAKAAAHDSAVAAELQAKDDGSGAMGQIGAGALGALKGTAENPRAGAAMIFENYGGMKAIAKGTEKVLARYLPEIDAAVKAGTMTKDAANARVADLAGKISPVGEGILTAGQGAQQVRSENPNATAADYLLQAPAGFITGAIARGVGRIPGLENVEATMALNAMGRPSGFTGGVLKRAGKGVLSEGVLQEVPQSAQEQAWVNAATGKPLQEGVGESAVQGLIAGGAMGGGAAGMSGVAEHLRAPAQGNVDPAAVPAQPSTTGGPAQDSSAQALVAEALAAETAAQPATTSSAPAGDHPLAAPIAQTNKAGPAGATISTTNEGEQQNGDQAQVTLAQQAGQQEVGEAATDPAGRADQSAEGGGNVPGAGRQGVAAEAQKAETRADFYERLADEREQPGPAADPGRAAQYRAKADKLRADAVARIAQGFTGSDQPTTSGALPQQSTAMPVPDAWKAAKLSPAKEMLSSNHKLAPTVKENFAADPAAKAVGISAVRAKQSPIQKRDDLVGAIMRVTGGAGINSSMALDTTGDDAGKAVKLRGMFTNRGTIDLDDTAHLLRVEEGYDVRDGAHLAELIRQAAAGDVAVSMERMQRDKDAEQERQHRDRIRARAKKLGVKTVAVKFSDMEANVLAVEKKRHDAAVAKLEARDKKRFDDAVAQSESLLSDAEIRAIILDVEERGMTGREKWREALVLQRQLADEARYQKEQGELEDAESRATTEEPDWFKDFDEEGNRQAGDGGAPAARNAADEGRSGEGQAEQGRDDRNSERVRGGSEAGSKGNGQKAGLELAGQTRAEIARQEADRVAAEKAARESVEKEAKAKKDAEQKALDEKVKARTDDPDNFVFGEDGKAAANPTGGLFDQPAAVAQEPVIGYDGHPGKFGWAENEVGGAVIYSSGDIALVEGFSPLGNAVYAGVKGDSRTRADISAYTGKMFSETEKAELEKAKADHVKEQGRLHEKAPEGPFSNGARFAKSESVSDELAGVAQKWLGLMGIKSRVFLATKGDVSSKAAIDRYGLRGPFSAVRSAGTQNDADGSKRTLPNGDHYIILPRSARKSQALEALAHEIGHILEADEWSGADRATKDAVMADYQKWLNSAGNTKAADWVKQLRAHTSGKLTHVATSETADRLPPYWRSFSEYFADQVSRWATTTDRPLTVVDAFFRRVALAMRRLYAKAAGKPYLPGQAMKAYLDARALASPLELPSAPAEKAPATPQLPQAADASVSAESLKLNDNIKFTPHTVSKLTPVADDGAVGNLAGAANISVADSAIYDMAAEGKSAQEILAFIGSSTHQPFNHYLAKALANLGVKSSISIDSRGGWKFNRGKAGAKYAAAYNPTTDAVALFTPREAERNVLHELVHAATLKAIAKGGPAATQMRHLFNSLGATQRSGLAGQYGMESLDEFVAEAFSNPQFQQALDKLPAPAGSTLKNAWRSFVRIVARLLGIKTAAGESALSEAMRIGARLMRENAALNMESSGYSVYSKAHGLPEGFPAPRAINGAELTALRRAAAGIERPQSGIFLRITEDGKAIASGPKGKLIPGSFRRFANEHGLRFYAERNAGEQSRNTAAQYKQISVESEPIPISYRQSGALYFGDTVGPRLDRTEMTRFREADDENVSGNVGGDIEPDEYIDRASSIIEIHGVKNAAKADAMAKRMAESEQWEGRPLLAYRDASGAIFSITGSHRLAAAKKAGIPVPVVFVDDATTEFENSKGDFLADVVGSGDDRVVDFLNESGDKRAAALMGAEIKAVVAPKDAITIDGVERPRMNSNGKPIAQTDEALRKFYAWFGDSKVVDEQGRPLVVYHGSKENFSVFDSSFSDPTMRGIGFHVTSEKRRAAAFSGGAEPMALYVSMSSPLQAGRGFNGRLEQEHGKYESAKAVSAMKAKGYDGLEFSTPEGKHFAPFDAVQLKSATGENNEFSPDNPDIRFREADDENVSGNVGGDISDTITIDGVERPRLNSNGKPIAQTDEALRKFYAWFKNSRVVDEQGRPLVVYHGTASDVANFAPGNGSSDGFHFSSSPDVASRFAQSRAMDGGKGANVVPAYLAMQNPKAVAIASNAEISDAQEGGHDGLAAKGGHYVAISAEQIKSATGNTGEFSHDNPDIRYNIAGTPPTVGPVAAGNLWQRAKARAAKLLKPGTLDKVIYEMQDKHIDLRRLRDHIKQIGGVITDMNDAYLGEELYHKRLAHRVESFAADELNPLLADMRAKSVGAEEFETFLHARHAPEANAEMAKRNPNQAEIDAGQQAAKAVVTQLENHLQRAQKAGTATTAIDKALNDARGDLSDWNGAQAFHGTEDERLSLSGMSDAAAAAVMSGLSPEKRAKLDALAARVDAINAGTIQLLDDYGLMSKDALRAWKTTYQHYIPLHRDEAHPDSNSHPIGQGFSTKGDASKRRTGSNAKVTNILGHIAMQRESALTRGEKNHVMLKLYLMARQNPLPDVWKVGAVPMLDTIDKATGFVKSVPDPLYRNRPNVVMLRIAGKDVAITLNENNPEAARLAQALKNLDVDDLHYLIPVVGKVTRYFAAVNTQYNPIFGLINLLRDTQEAALNLSTTPIAGKQGEVLRDTLSILKEVLKNRGRMPATGPWAALFTELREVGGTTGYRDLFLDAESRSKALLSEMKAMDRGRAAKAWHSVTSWLSDYNEAMENATRLAAYKAALDSGMSKGRAASLAKNLTVNFNRKGRQTRELGALYAFFNAAVQGTARMAQTLAGPAGRKIMAGGVMLGALNTLIGFAAMGGGGDGDDDEWEKIPEFVKQRSIIIPIGKQDYITIPMPLGFQFLPNIGRLTMEMAIYKDKTAGKQMASLFSVLADAFNPLGGSSPALQIISPTVMDPFVALAQNKDWTGQPIYRENRSALDPDPGFKRAKDSATPIAKGIAEAINTLTGGTEYTPGGWSPTPDQLDYVAGQLTGGVGREIGKATSTAAAPFTGEELPAYKIPLVGRLYGNTKGASGESQKFYENITRANEAENEIKGRLKSGRGVAEYLQENPRAMDLAAQGNAAERQASLLRKMRSGIIEQDPPDKVERVREINSQIAAVMRGFNRAASVQ